MHYVATLLVLGLAAGTAMALVPPTQCQKVMNSWCSSEADGGCAPALKDKKCDVSELIALEDTDASGGSNKWRCYSPDALNADKTRYDTKKNSTCYCTRESQLVDVLRSCEGLAVNSNAFVAGKDAPFYNCFRIPSLLRLPNGDLVAFAEARHAGGATNSADFHSCPDHAWVDMSMKRSTDGGRTWKDFTVVHSESSPSKFVTIGNPAPVYTKAGALLLPCCRDNKQVLLLNSTDGGKTWSPPRELSSSVVMPSWSWVATGPPGGLQLDSGRIVIPADHEEHGTASHSMYSDDNGATWKLSNAIPGGNECQATVVSNGTVIMSMRSGGADRLWAASTDGGATWGAPTSHPTIKETPCEGSIVTLSSGLTVLSSSFASSRMNLTLHVSTDSGASFRPAVTVYPGSSAYSSIVALNATAVGLLYEADSYSRIAYTAVDLSRWV